MNLKRRMLSVFLTLAMLLSLMPAMAAAEDLPTGSWQDAGVPDTSWFDTPSAGQDGSASHPYVLGNAEELAGLASLAADRTHFAGLYIKLDADIDLGGKLWTPIGTDACRFAGNFDGDGHVIKNMTIHADSDSNAGLFGVINTDYGNCSIKNLGMVDVNISGDGIRYAGALATEVFVTGMSGYDFTVDNCFATGSIRSGYLLSCLGGLLGEMMINGASGNSVIVSDCYSNCDISLDSADGQNYYTRYAGGLLGDMVYYGGSASVNITDCYSASKVETANPDRSKIGAFLGYVNNSSVLTVGGCLFDMQAASIGYATDKTSAAFFGAEGKLTSQMTGAGAVPSSWDSGKWQAGAGLYPQLATFAASADPDAKDSSLISAIPVKLFENGSVPALSDTSALLRHGFTVPVIAGVTWSSDNAAVLSVGPSGGNVTFSSPASDTEVTLTAALESGIKKDFVLMCKAGADPADATPPAVTIEEIAPSDFSASVNVSADEPSDLYVLVRAAGDLPPGAGDILVDSHTIKLTGIAANTPAAASIPELDCLTDYVAYAVGTDPSGNVSSVISQAFSTEQDHTPPTMSGYNMVTVSSGTASFFVSYNEAGTIHCIVLPSASSSTPSNIQVAAGKDAHGNTAFYAGDTDYLTAGANCTVSFDVSSFEPDTYYVYYVCEDAVSNISSVGSPVLGPGYPAFEIRGQVTFTVTDSSTSDVLEGVSVKIGSKTKTTDADGTAVFTLSGGDYTYLAQKEGYRGASGSLNVNQQAMTKGVALTPGGGGLYSASFHVTDTSGAVAGAEVTIGPDTKTTDSGGNAEFYLESGSYDYSVSAVGRAAKTGGITIDAENITENITLDLDTAGVAVAITGHTEGQLESELAAYLSAYSLTNGMVTSLSVAGGTVNAADTAAIRSRFADTLKTLDFSGTAFDGNAVPDGALVNCYVLTDLILPDSVTAIGAEAFYWCIGLTDVTLPAGITDIGYAAFYQCTGLSSVALPASLQTIGSSAFWNCSDLTAVTLPASVVSIGNSAFYQSGLTDLYLLSPTPPSVGSNIFGGHPENAKVHVPANSRSAFYNCDDGDTTDRYWYDLLVDDPEMGPFLEESQTVRTSDTEATIDFTSDKGGAYYYAVVDSGAAEPGIDTSGAGTALIEDYNVLNATLTAGAKDLYIIAKSEDEKLGNKLKIEIPAYVPPIDVVITGHQAGSLASEVDDYLEAHGFSEEYEWIESLKVSGGTINGYTADGSYGDGADTDEDYIVNNFFDWVRLKTLDFSGTSFENNAISDELFAMKTSLVNAYLPEGVTEIGDDAFMYCVYLTDITLPSSVTSIGDRAFGACFSLESVTLPAGVTSIGDEAFTSCQSLGNLTLLSSTPPSVGEDAFSDIMDGAAAHVPYGSSAAYLAAPDGDTTDDLWYGLVITSSSAAVGNVTVTGTTGSPITDTDVTITISDDSLVAISAGTDLSGWFTNLPAGLTAKAAVDVTDGGASVTVTISGTPSETSNAVMAITIPASGMTGGIALPVTSNAGAKFNITSNSAFVPITGITGVPTTATAGVNLTLSGTVAPANATNQTIVWSVQSAGTTGATVTGSTLSTTAAGTVTVRATIANGLTESTNYTKDFDITVNTAFVPVTNITGVPTTATAGVGLTLSGTVAPANATKQTIVWSVQSAGTTGATVTGSTLSTTAAGTVTVRATIANGLTESTNYTKDFDITVSAAAPTVTSVTVSPLTITVQKGHQQQFSATVSGTNNPAQTVTWSVYGGGAGTSIDSDGELTIAADETAGTLTVTATSTVNTLKSGSATVTVTDVPPSTYSATVLVRKDGSDWTSGAPAFTIGVDAGSAVVSGSNLADGTYNIYADGADTGADITVSGAAVSVTLDYYTLTLNAGAGIESVSGDGIYLSGASASIDAVVSSGYIWEKWSDNNTAKARTVPMSNTLTLTASAALTPPTFTAVTGITGVPATATAGVNLTLSGTVAPVNATNQTIVWSVQNPGTTGATVSGNTLSTTSAGIVIVTATIANGLTESTDYTQDFTITVTAASAATYTVTFISNGSVYTTETVNAGESIGSAAWPADPTRSSYTFGGWFTGENGAGAQFTATTSVNAITTVYAKWTYSGGSGGGDSTPPTPAAPTTPTAPTYNADVEAGNGTKMTLHVTIDKAAGRARVDTGSQTLTPEGTVVTMPSIPDVNTYSVVIRVPELSKPSKQGTLTLNTNNGSVTVPSNMLTDVEGISGSKAEISIGKGDKSPLPEDVKAAIGDRPLVQLTLSVDGKQTDWSNPGVPVTVSIPYTPAAEELVHPESIVIWYIDGRGNVVSIPNGHYDAAAGTVTFDTTHFSDYAVVHNPISFNDVAAGAWYGKAVSFIAAREITSGTGNGNYSPEAKLTRGEFIVLMMKAYGIAPDTNPTENFSDAGNTYYTDYLAAAKRLGIATGIGNNQYAPGKEITRQEMFTLLYKALKVIGQLPQGDSGKTLSDFTDAGQIDAWAKDAMTLLAKTGTVSGNNGALTPLSTTSRAEMAQVLYNLLSK